VWRYAYRAVDQYGQIIDVLLSIHSDAAAARRFFTGAPPMLKVVPSEVVIDAAPVYPGVLDQLLPPAWHHVEQYATNRIEADHGQLTRRLRPMRGLQTDWTAQVLIAGHPLVRNVRRGHYELGVDPARAAGRGVHRTCRRDLTPVWLTSVRPPIAQRNNVSWKVFGVPAVSSLAVLAATSA
jgi:transposase-like protein